MMQDKLNILLNTIIGATCWHFGGGGCTGSMFNLKLGNKIPRKMPLPVNESNPLKYFDGEFDIFVQDARWRLLKNDVQIAHDESSSALDGELVTSLVQITGKRLFGYKLGKKYNLNLNFEGDLQLRISSSRKSHDIEAKIPLYSVFVRGEHISIPSRPFI